MSLSVGRRSLAPAPPLRVGFVVGASFEREDCLHMNENLWGEVLSLLTLRLFFNLISLGNKQKSTWWVPKSAGLYLSLALTC